MGQDRKERLHRRYLCDSFCDSFILVFKFYNFLFKRLKTLSKRFKFSRFKTDLYLSVHQ